MENRVIAFIDILGFKTLAEKNTKEVLLKTIKPFYECKENIKKLELVLPNSMEATFFSDSIVLSCDEIDVKEFLSIIKMLLDEFILCKLFLRGGIALGKLYHSNDIVFGPAMNCAYELESKFAVYPSIIISDDVYKITNKLYPITVPKRKRFGENPYEAFENYSPTEDIGRDDDGFYFLNPFPRNIPVSDKHKIFGINSPIDFALKYKDILEKKLKEYKTKLKIFHKYFWLAKKLNVYYMAEKNITQINLEQF
ncbi:MAG: hypothetical protein PF484_00055 [Bacteroidales bacterium]|jgi:hypothetical protein|nr:hypothetical protein [Bacteroidales bacterium]